MTTTTTTEKKRQKRPRFWVGPLVAGSCFALGYGITQRIVLLRQAQQEPEQATFQQSSFPGQTLDSLRRFYGADQPLMGDVTAKEAADADQRQLNGEAEAIAAEAVRRETKQQAALLEPARSLPPNDLRSQPAPVLQIEDPDPETLPAAAVETMDPDPVSLPTPTLEQRLQEPGAVFQAPPVRADAGPAQVEPVSEPLNTPKPTFDFQTFDSLLTAPPTP